MSTLVSPGVSVTVQNDSFYPASGSGSVPLVIFATAQDKLVPGSTSTVAAGTMKANAGKMYLMTSQRDVLQAFGMPIFQEAAGTVVQGDELNEYGLHGLFSALGITNNAYAIRADIDLNALQPTQVEPRSVPLNQTVWFDISASDFGIFEHLGTSSPNQIVNWKKVNVIVPAITQVDTTSGKPSDDIGVAGDYAVVPYLVNSSNVVSEINVTTPIADAVNLVWRKTKETGNVWQQVVDIDYQALTPPTEKSLGDVWIKLDAAAGGMNPVFHRYSAGRWDAINTVAEKDIMHVESKFGSSLRAGSYCFDASLKYFFYRGTDAQTAMEIPNATQFNSKTISIKWTAPQAVGVQVIQKEFVSVSDLVSVINTQTPLSAVANGNAVSVKSLVGRVFEIRNVADDATAGVDSFVSNKNWVPTRYFAQATSPTLTASSDTIWYDDSLYADVMINDGGRWRGLQTEGGRSVIGASSAAEVQIRQTEPAAKASGGNLEFGDMWIDPQDGTNYEFYQYNGNAWTKLDATDQSTTLGVLFADARVSDASGVGYYTTDASTASAALLSSDYVDPTCPDPRLYPRGMVMVNLGQTGGVVRKYTSDAFAEVQFTDINNDTLAEEYFVGDPASYDLAADGGRTPLTLASVDGNKRARWVTASGLSLDGSGLFGREAQRKLVVEAMAETIIGNDALRAETVEFNILSAPGYVELLDELVTLNVDRKETAYIITDVPARLAPNATAINEWALNVNNAPSNGSTGRITRYDYAAQYMGWGLGTNVDGKEVAIPGSSVALRTYLYNDSVAYVWFPPAGTERGVVTNAASVGYVNNEGEYTPVIYNLGQRNVMYQNNINPIAMRPNRGLLVWGDKSLASSTTALDRVNVGRLVVYLRTEIEKIAERFLFKLNTPRVQEEFAGALTSFLANIVQLEGLEDFVVVCDSSNNTALRRARNELWADIAIVPTKSINFVYVPIRIQNASN